MAEPSDTSPLDRLVVWKPAHNEKGTDFESPASIKTHGCPSQQLVAEYGAKLIWKKEAKTRAIVTTKPMVPLWAPVLVMKSWDWWKEEKVRVV